MFLYRNNVPDLVALFLTFLHCNYAPYSGGYFYLQSVPAMLHTLVATFHYFSLPEQCPRHGGFVFGGYIPLLSVLANMPHYLVATFLYLLYPTFWTMLHMVN